LRGARRARSIRRVIVARSPGRKERPGCVPRAAAPRQAVVQCAGLALALAAAWTASVSPAGATWLGVRGPACPLGACLDPLACPGCGLLRGTCAALQGDVAPAFAAHPGAPVVAALVLGATLLQLDVLRTRCERPFHVVARRAGRAALAAAILGGWLLRLCLS
jgi:hypothetical protein